MENLIDYLSHYQSRAPQPLQLVHTDLWGPAPITSSNRYQYYISFVDYFSRFSWIFPLKYKEDAITIFRQFKEQVYNLYEAKIKIVRCDEDGEFKPLL